MAATTQHDLIHETSTTTGTGNFTTAAVNGKVQFGDSTNGFGTGATTNVFDYYISNRDQAEWERGTGHCSALGTLVRDTVTASSNAGSLVSFSAGTKDVTNDIPAGKQMRSDIIGTKVSNSLGADVTLNNASTYFDGPSVAQGTVGTWFASGTITLIDSVGSTGYDVKLWDGTNVIASCSTRSSAASVPISVSLSGALATPAANIKISARPSRTTSLMLFNQSGETKDSTLTAHRIG